MALRQKPQPEILRDVGVLVLVHQHVAEALLVIGEDVGAPRENREIVQQEIAEIDGIEREEPLLISLEKAGAAAVGEAALVFHGDLLRPKAAVFPALDRAQERAGGPAFLVDAGGGGEL